MSDLYEAIEKGDKGKIIALIASGEIDAILAENKELPSDFVARLEQNEDWVSAYGYESSDGGHMLHLLMQAEREAKENAKKKAAPLWESIEKDFTEQALELIRLRKEDLNIGKSINHETPLMLAAEKGKINIMKALIDAGVDVNRKVTLSPVHADPRNDLTALHLAAESGEIDAIQVLIDAEADPNKARYDGMTSLMLIIERINFVVEYMLLSEQEQRRCYWFKKNAFTINQYENIIERLINSGADVTLKDKSDKTVLDHVSFIQELNSFGLQDGSLFKACENIYNILNSALSTTKESKEKSAVESQGFTSFSPIYSGMKRSPSPLTISVDKRQKTRAVRQEKQSEGTSLRKL